MSVFTNLLMLRKSPVIRSIGIYTFTNFFSKGVSFLLLFLYTNPKYISPSENGLLSLFSTSVIFLMPFISMGILQSTSTDFFKLEKKEFNHFFTTGFIMPLAVSVLGFFVLFFLRAHLNTAYGFPLMFVWLIPLLAFLNFCFEQLISLVRNNGEPMRFLGINLSKTFIELGLSVVLVIFFAWRWEGRIAGIITAYVLSGGYAFYYFYTKGYLSGTVKKQYLYSELVYAIPIIALQASVFALSSSDKFFLSRFAGDNNETVGIYSVACAFASVVNILCTAYLQYLFPKIFSTLSEKTINHASIRKHFYSYIAVMVAGTVLLLALTPLLYKYFINEKYHSALGYIFLLMLGNFLWAAAYYFYSFLLFYKQKKTILLIASGSIVVSLACNYFFIGHWNVYGAAVSVCTSYFITLIIILIAVRKYIQQFFLNKNKPGIHTNE